MHKRRFTEERVGDLLVNAGIVTTEDLEKALQAQKNNSCRIGEIFIKSNLVNEYDIVTALIAQYHFPYIPLENFSINLDVLKTVPEGVARKYLVIPLDQLGNCFTVAMADPLDNQAINEIEMLSQCHVAPYITTASDISYHITKYYSPDKYAALFPEILKYL